MIEAVHIFQISRLLPGSHQNTVAINTRYIFLSNAQGYAKCTSLLRELDLFMYSQTISNRKPFFSENCMKTCHKSISGRRTAAMKILEIEVCRMSHLVGVGTWTPSRCKTTVKAEVIELRHMWMPAMLAVHFSQSLKILSWTRRF